MAFEVHYDSESDIVCASASGDMDAKQIEIFAVEVRRVSTEHKCRRLLNDLRQITSKLSVADIYEIPDMLLKKGAPRIKRAMVVSGDLEQFRFFETVSQNRGQRVKIFRDIEEAKQWLLED